MAEILVGVVVVAAIGWILVSGPRVLRAVLVWALVALVGIALIAGVMAERRPGIGVIALAIGIGVAFFWLIDRPNYRSPHR